MILVRRNTTASSPRSMHRFLALPTPCAQSGSYNRNPSRRSRPWLVLDHDLHVLVQRGQKRHQPPRGSRRACRWPTQRPSAVDAELFSGRRRGCHRVDVLIPLWATCFERHSPSVGPNASNASGEQLGDFCHGDEQPPTSGDNRHKTITLIELSNLIRLRIDHEGVGGNLVP